MEMLTREQYKTYVKMVLNSVEDSDSSVGGGNEASQPKFFGHHSFSGMSKKVGKQWKQADALTRSVFKDLAKEEMQRFRKVSHYYFGSSAGSLYIVHCSQMKTVNVLLSECI